MDKMTIVTACDRKYIHKLLVTLPTWRIVKGWTGPITIFVNGWTRRSLAKSPQFDLFRKLNCRLIKWEWPNAETQREKMLSAFIFGVAQYIETPFHCKLDSETVGYQPGPWYEESWFDNYDLIASPWGYTKPGVFVERIDYWMNGLYRAGLIPQPTHIQKPEKYYEVWKGPKKPDGTQDRQIRWYVERQYRYTGNPDNWRRQKHGSARICSWIKIMRTSVVRDIANALPLGRLSAASEDTTCWRWCHNLNLRILRFKFKRVGWTQHTKRWGQLAKVAMENYANRTTK